MFAQDVLTLGFPDFCLGISGDLFTKLQDLYFFRQGGVEAAQEVEGRRTLEQTLLLHHIEIHQRGDTIGQRDRVIFITQYGTDFLNGRSLDQSGQLGHKLLNGSVKCLHLRSLVRRTSESPNTHGGVRSRLLLF